MLRGWWRSALMGLGGLLAVNISGAFTGVTLGFSWLCIGVSALLGVPGVALIVLLQGVLK